MHTELEAAKRRNADILSNTSTLVLRNMVRCGTMWCMVRCLSLLIYAHLFRYLPFCCCSPTTSIKAAASRGAIACFLCIYRSTYIYMHVRTVKKSQNESKTTEASATALHSNCTNVHTAKVKVETRECRRACSFWFQKVFPTAKMRFPFTKAVNHQSRFYTNTTLFITWTHIHTYVVVDYFCYKQNVDCDWSVNTSRTKDAHCCSREPRGKECQRNVMNYCEYWSNLLRHGFDAANLLLNTGWKQCDHPRTLRDCDEFWR